MRRRGRQWEAEVERRSFPFLALKPHPPVVALDEFSREVQPDAHAACMVVKGSGVRAVETLEDSRLAVRGDTDPVITHRHDEVVTFPLRYHLDPAPRRRVLDGVVKQVG